MIMEMAGLEEMEVPEVIRGVYLLLRDGVVVYVGQAADITARTLGHIKEGIKQFDEVRIIRLPDGSMDRIEMELTFQFEPEYCGRSSWNGLPQYIPKGMFGGKR